MLKAVIIDDEAHAIDALCDLLAECGHVRVTATFTDPAEALDAIRRTHTDADIVFLDIEMQGIRGLELAAMLPDVCPKAHIVFTTAYDQFALEAFELNAIDYLLKPVRIERLAKTISRLVKSVRSSHEGDAERVAGDVRIACFGSFRILIGPGPLQPIKWRTSKVRELFAYLIHHLGTAVHKEKIIEDIWPNMQTERAIGYLHTCIYQLRKLIRDCHLGEQMSVTYNNGAYELQMNGIACDVEEFLRIADRKGPIDSDTVAECERAATLYYGHYFDEDDFAWAVPLRHRLLEVYFKLMHDLADYYLQIGQPNRAAFHLRELLSKDPLREESHQRLLVCLAKAGDRVALIRHYHAMERLFHEELGIAPSPETKALFRRLS